MKKPVFVTYCLIVFSIFLESYFFFRLYFSGVDQLKINVAQMQKKLEREEFQTLLARSELTDYQQQVATLMPDALKRPTDKGHEAQLRELASVVDSKSAEGLQIERASSLLEAGKTAFRKNLFEDSNDRFRKLLTQYPDSTHATEADFLLAEGLFKVKDYEACIEVVDNMLTLYPDSELTGFALLRLGKIYETQDRLEDAIEMYKTVLKSYHDKSLLAQAKSNLKAVEL